MPKISAPTVVANRVLRRQQIIAAAAELALEMDGKAITMSAIAARAGISRTAIYEYFASTNDLLADLIIDELGIWAKTLQEIVDGEISADAKVEAWIRGALAFVADGRHVLVKALSAVSLPNDRVNEVTNAHRRLVAPLVETMQSMGVADPIAAAFLINSTVESATRRIEQGANSTEIISLTVEFARGGLRSLAR